MSPIGHLRQSIGQDVLDYQVLSDALRAYRKPADRVRRMVDSGEIVRVKQGLYVFAAPFRRRLIVREYLANLIHGPSYVSLESALGFHSLIPERVESVTSVTLGRSRQFDTPFGSFTYYGLSRRRYVGGPFIEARDGVSFLMASPEKALVDTVWATKSFSGRTVGAFRDYLFDDLRIDEEALVRLDMRRLESIGRGYASCKIHNLLRFVSSLATQTYG
jgi:hypothetical protein